MVEILGVVRTDVTVLAGRVEVIVSSIVCCCVVVKVKFCTIVVGLTFTDVMVVPFWVIVKVSEQILVMVEASTMVVGLADTEVMVCVEIMVVG